MNSYREDTTGFKFGKKLFTNIKNPLRKIFFPVIYSYPGYILYDFIQRLNGNRKDRRRFYNKLGYYPDLKNPKSFNEKILWKKIYDRNPLLPVVSDKYGVRQYLKQVIGENEAEKILIPLFFVTSDPVRIPFEVLSEEYVIKPNHGSGMIILAENIEGQKRFTFPRRKKDNIFFDCVDTKNEIIKTCKYWLSKPYHFQMREWAYQKIERKIIIERLLRDNSGKISNEYKFTIFHGKCDQITVWYDRFTDLTMGRYTPEWDFINVKGEGIKIATCKKKPENLQSMINLAELLGKPFDYVRVDLILCDNHIYFGELTNYTAGGTIIFDPASYDFELGAKWRVAHRYWKLV